LRISRANDPSAELLPKKTQASANWNADGFWKAKMNKKRRPSSSRINRARSFCIAFDKTVIPLLNFLFPTQIALMDMGSGGSYKLWAMLDPKSFFLFPCTSKTVLA
jgi:hypothetical protein